jgi:hypothetical protein
MILEHGRHIATEFGILATVFCSLNVGWFQIEPFLSIGIRLAHLFSTTHRDPRDLPEST